MNRINQVVAVICLLIAVTLYLLTPSQVSSVSSSSGITLGADFFPRFVSILMGLSAVGLFVQSQIAINHHYETEERPVSDPRREFRVAVAIFLLVLYAVYMPDLGFTISSLLFGAAFLAFLKVKVWWYYLIYAASVFVIFYVFTDLLYVFLPRYGWWIL